MSGYGESSTMIVILEPSGSARLNNRLNNPLPTSTKVVVEGERRSDAEPFHDGETGAVHKAESLITQSLCENNVLTMM